MTIGLNLRVTFLLKVFCSNGLSFVYSLLCQPQSKINGKYYTRKDILHYIWLCDNVCIFLLSKCTHLWVDVRVNCPLILINTAGLSLYEGYLSTFEDRWWLHKITIDFGTSGQYLHVSSQIGRPPKCKVTNEQQLDSNLWDTWSWLQLSLIIPQCFVIVIITLC